MLDVIYNESPIVAVLPPLDSAPDIATLVSPPRDASSRITPGISPCVINGLLLPAPPYLPAFRTLDLLYDLDLDYEF